MAEAWDRAWDNNPFGGKNLLSERKRPINARPTRNPKLHGCCSPFSEYEGNYSHGRFIRLPKLEKLRNDIDFVSCRKRPDSG